MHFQANKPYKILYLLLNKFSLMATPYESLLLA